MAALLSSSSPLLLRKFLNPSVRKKPCFPSPVNCLPRISPFSSSLVSRSNAFIKRLTFQIQSTLQEVPYTSVSDPDGTVEEELEKTQQQIQQDRRKRRLYVENLPWTMSSTDLQNLFVQCGTVKDVEVLKNKKGESRGFAFVTMASADEARAAIEKFDSFELEGRIIRVEYAKSLKKPSPSPPPPPPPPDPVAVETRHTIYASNLAWKLRSNNLREFFMASGNPLSVRVVFESPSGRSAGYGFVSYATEEEAEAAVAALNGKELMGRPLRLIISQKKLNESEGKNEEANAGKVLAEES